MRGFGFQQLNNLRVKAPALLFRGSFHCPIDLIGHVLERDVHGTILEPFTVPCKRAPLRASSEIV